jgi:hypothetical protein
MRMDVMGHSPRGSVLWRARQRGRGRLAGRADRPVPVRRLEAVILNKAMSLVVASALPFPAGSMPLAASWRSSSTCSHMFAPNPMGALARAWPAPADAIGLYDLSPLRRSLEQFVDFERLDGGDVRLLVVAVDLGNRSSLYAGCPPRRQRSSRWTGILKQTFMRLSKNSPMQSAHSCRSTWP